MEIIIFSVLLVVGALVLITMNVPGYFPQVNAHASATKHQRSVKNIQRLEHDLRMCGSECPHHLKLPPPPAASVRKALPIHRVPRFVGHTGERRVESETEIIKDGFGRPVAMIVYDDLLGSAKVYPAQRPKGQVPPGKILR